MELGRFSLSTFPVRASNAALDVGNDRAGRKSSDTCHRFPHDLRTIESRSRNIPYWPLLGRDSRPHLLNFSILRLRSFLAWRGVYESAQANAHECQPATGSLCR